MIRSARQVAHEILDDAGDFCIYEEHSEACDRATRTVTQAYASVVDAVEDAIDVPNSSALSPETLRTLDLIRRGVGPWPPT